MGNPDKMIVISPEGQRVCVPTVMLRAYIFHGYHVPEEKELHSLNGCEKYDFTKHNMSELRIFATAADVAWRGLKKAELILALIDAGYTPPITKGGMVNGS